MVAPKANNPCCPPLPRYNPRTRWWELRGADVIESSWDYIIDEYAQAGTIYHYDTLVPETSKPQTPDQDSSTQPHRVRDHKHAWDGILFEILCHPESFHICEEDRTEYSGQELCAIAALQAQLRSAGFKDGDLYDALYPSSSTPRVKTHIVAGTPGVGKSITARTLGTTALDLDGKPYKYLEESNRLNPDWPHNYCEAIKEAWLSEVYSFVFVSAEPFVLSTLERMEVPYTLVYPDESRREEFCRRIAASEDASAFATGQLDRWDAWIDLYEYSFNPSSSRKLPPAEDLIDILGYPDFDELFWYC